MTFFKPNTKPDCTYFRYVSQLIRGKGNYIDSHYFCSLLQIKISKKQCTECAKYKPTIRTNG